MLQIANRRSFRGAFSYGLAFSCLGITALIAVIVGVRGAKRFLSAPSRSMWAAVAEDARDRPFQVAISCDKVFPMSREDVNWLRQQVEPPPDGRMTSSLCLHQMHLRGVDVECMVEGNPASVLQMLLSEALGRQYLGKPALVRTRYGIRFPRVGSGPLARGQELHRDQCLAGFATLGVPLSQKVIVGGETFSVRDILSDSLAEFHLGQRELAWSALAYALYLPPVRGWTNRFDESFTFDILVEEMLKRPLNRASCCGMHLVYSLTMIALVDAEVPIVSEPIRSRLLARLRELVQASIVGQRADGAWPVDWHAGIGPDAVLSNEFSPPSTPDGVLLATGHVAEWLLVLPEEMRVPRELQERAAGYLWGDCRNLLQRSS